MKSEDEVYVKRSIEISIRLIIFFITMGWCYVILRPFINAVFGGIILAVALYPIFIFFRKHTKLSDIWNAVLITILSLLILIVPSYLLLISLIDEIQVIVADVQNNNLSIPSVPSWVEGWPIIGEPIEDAWLLASKNMSLLYLKYESQFHSVGSWLFGIATDFSIGIFHLLASIILSGILLAHSKASSKLVHKFFLRIAGSNGDEFAHIAERTIQNVTKGIIGAAVIESALAGIGMAIAGVPLVGVWTMGCLILCIVQIGFIPIVLPVVIYMFYNADPVIAILLAIWMIFAYLLEYYLKPLLLGKGAPVPMPVIFIGVIGGFIAAGFIGMFIGAVVFSIIYKLSLIWLESGPNKEEEEVRNI
jgi:predicted PurR-regulated permease PerM